MSPSNPTYKSEPTLMRTQLEMFRNRVSLEMEMPQPAGRFNIVLRDAVQKRHLP